MKHRIFILLLIFMCSSLCMGSTVDDLLLIRKIDIKYSMYFRVDSTGGVYYPSAPYPVAYPYPYSYPSYYPTSISTVRCGAEVTNNSDVPLKDLQIICRFTDGFDNLDQSVQTITLDAGQRVRLIFPSSISSSTQPPMSMDTASNIPYLSPGDEGSFLGGGSTPALGARVDLPVVINLQEKRIQPKFSVFMNNREYRHD